MNSNRFTSIATSPGIAIGKAYHLKHLGKHTFVRTWVRDIDVEVEVERFRKAIQLAKEKLSKIQSKMCRFQGHEQIDIIESYRLFLQDDMLVNTTIDNIINYKINAEWALDKTLGHLRLSFLNVHEEYIRERHQDIDYVGRIIMDHLLGRPEIPLQDLPPGDIILLAHDLSPAEIAVLPKDRIRGFIMEVGGDTSHTAIIARSLEIPAIFGVKDITAKVKDGDEIILDGMKGLAILSPSKEELDEYKSIQKRYLDLEKMLMQDAKLPAETQDGYRISLDANIELIEEIPSVLQHGAEGIGLYRTEYLFLNRLDEPTEEEQFLNYVKVLEELAPNPVTIRTIDLGADKLPISKEIDEQTNPALGLRGIRVCLRERTTFKNQLRALLRASPFGKLKILLPMVTNVDEIKETKKIIEEIKLELKEKKIAFDDKVPLGVMIEVPAAVFISDTLAAEADFFSIGTNDLIQYSLAIDRSNELVSEMYTPYHPAILHLLARTAEAAKKAKIPLSVCGEMAGDPFTIILMLGIGVTSLSMNPVSLPIVKKVLRSITMKKSKKLFEKALSLKSHIEIRKLLREEMGHLLPKQVQQLESLFAYR